MKTLLCLSAIAMLVGCVTPSKQPDRPTARDDPSNGCFAGIAYDARFVGLREKMAVNIKADAPSLDMLSDKSYPTAAEKQMLSVWKVARDTCSEMGAQFRATYAPLDYQQTLKATQLRINLLLARLVSNEITWSDFNRLRAENSVDQQGRIAATAQRERDANAAAAAQDEDRRRQAVGAALQNMQAQQQINQQNALQQQQIMNQNRPRQTNCQRIGNQMNCTTY